MSVLRSQARATRTVTGVDGPHRLSRDLLAESSKDLGGDLIDQRLGRGDVDDCGSQQETQLEQCRLADSIVRVSEDSLHRVERDEGLSGRRRTAGQSAGSEERASTHATISIDSSRSILSRTSRCHASGSTVGRQYILTEGRGRTADSGVGERAERSDHVLSHALCTRQQQHDSMSRRTRSWNSIGSSVIFM